MMRKCYSGSRSPIYENNDIVSKSWIVQRHGIVAKLTSAVVFTAADDLAFSSSHVHFNSSTDTQEEVHLLIGLPFHVKTHCFHHHIHNQNYFTSSRFHLTQILIIFIRKCLQTSCRDTYSVGLYIHSQNQFTSSCFHFN